MALPSGGGGGGPPPAVESNCVGMLVSGRPVTTDFLAVSADKLVTQLVAPASVSEVSFFLLPGFALPPDKGLVIYYSADGSSWAALGALHAGRPSATFVPQWRGIPELSAAPALQIGVSVESGDAVRAVLALESSTGLEKLAFAGALAQAVARDAMEYLGSFATSQPGMVGDRVVLPPDALAKWLAKLEGKLARDGPFALLSKPSG